MKTYVAVTDQRWYEFLAARPQLTEANFGMPGGGPKVFGAVQPGEAFLFKTHHPHNRIVGGGFLADYRRLPLGTAWRELGEANGVGSEEAMRQAIGRYRRAPLDPYVYPEIGCAMLCATPSSSRIRTCGRASRSSHRQRGARQELRARRAPRISRRGGVLAVARRRTRRDDRHRAVLLRREADPWEQPRLVAPRLGQRSFAAVVQGAYGHCAVTGNKVLPTLQAAHILPVAAQGPAPGRQRAPPAGRRAHHVRPRLPGRQPGKTKALQVSPRLREMFGNGEEFTRGAGTLDRAARHGVADLPEPVVSSSGTSNAAFQP